MLEHRSRCEDQERVQTVHWDRQQTAIIICDMWDDHTCKAAAQRVAEMVPTMNRMVSAARETGVLIIHAPSGTMSFYDDTPQRRRAMEAPLTESPIEIKWNYWDPEREGEPLPFIRNGGCGCIASHVPVGSPTTRGLDSGRVVRCLGPGRSRRSKLPPKM